MLIHFHTDASKLTVLVAEMPEGSIIVNNLGTDMPPEITISAAKTLEIINKGRLDFHFKFKFEFGFWFHTDPFSNGYVRPQNII